MLDVIVMSAGHSRIGGNYFKIYKLPQQRPLPHTSLLPPRSRTQSEVASETQVFVLKPTLH